MLRRLLFVALLVALGLILAPRLFKSYPVQALVNAPAVELRSSVESVVLSTVPSSGRFEAEPVDVVRLQPRLADQLQALRAKEAMLAQRLSRFKQEEGKRLAQELAARQAELRRAELDLAEAGRALARQQTLVAAGFISANQLDTAGLRRDSAQAQRDIASANLQRARTNLDALVRQGFMGERAGGVDVSYTQQRLDEVRLRLAELAPWAERLGGAPRPGSGAKAAADPTDPAATVLRTPGRGLLMGPFVAEGAFLAPGDLVARFVQCERAFIDLVVPVIDLKDYRQGAPLSFRVAGEWQFYQGQVAQVFPLYLMGRQLALAVNPEGQGLEQMARVWVQPDAAFAERIRSESNCMMGHKLHAQLPGRSGWLPRWTTYLADVF